MDAPADEDAAAAVKRAQGNAEEASGPDAGGRPRGLLTQVAKAVDGGHRWYLERDEPDATGCWDDAHRPRMLSYVYDRNGGRCGLCAGEMYIRWEHRHGQRDYDQASGSFAATIGLLTVDTIAW